MTEMQRGYVHSLSHEELREEHLRLMERYYERSCAMNDTAEQVRSLYAGSEVSKRITALMAERDDLRAELDTLKSLGDNLPGYLHELVRDHNDKLRAELAEMKSKNAYLQQNYAEAKSDVLILTERLEQIRKNYERE